MKYMYHQKQSLSFSPLSFSIVTLCTLFATSTSFGATAAQPSTLSEIKSNPAIHGEIVEQLFDIAASIADRTGSVQLKNELGNSAETTSPHQKDTVLNRLSAESKELIFVEIGTKLLNDSLSHPFKTPSCVTTQVSQMDTFCLLVIALIDNEPQQQYIKFKNALATCIGVKDVWKIQARLSEYANIIPKALQARLFTRSPFALNNMKNRIKKLVETYN